MVPRPKTALVLTLASLGLLAALFISPPSQVATENLPARISDSEYWGLIGDFSEPGGFFRSDNFVSNETTFQHVIPQLRKQTQPGGVYLGVGPDQNFTYIVAVRPKLAFIVDIRRQNMLLHLMYKAIVEMSGDRAQFLSRLFSRPISGDFDANAPLEGLFEAFSREAPSAALFEENLRDVINRLTGHHQFQLTDDDVRTIEYVYRAFHTAGPDIRYSFPSQWGWRRFPSYSELMLETDGSGKNQSYMASHSNFMFLKEMHSENRIIPVVGDFAGEKCLRALGRFLRDHRGSVTAFYTSNVEFYLFQTEDWRRFYANLATMPLNEKSIFIRAYFNNSGFRLPVQHAGARSLTTVDGIKALLSAVNQGDISRYGDLFERAQ